MQRAPAPVVLLLSLLYLGLLDAGNRPARAQEPDALQPPALSNAQVQTADSGAVGPHIAVLLPLESSAFARAAEAVKRGVHEAHRTQPLPLPVVVYATTDDPVNVVKRYRDATRAQARLVIGPLARSAVTALAHSDAVTVPTLALNSADAFAASRSLYFFGMQSEAEARRMAQLASAQGHRRALVLTGGGQLTQRLAQTFIQAWRQQGNEIAREATLSPDATDLSNLREQLPSIAADAAFFALEPLQAKLARAYLGPGLAVYATSLVHTGDDPISRLDLDAIFFADMPWLVSPDDPAVLAYARPESSDLSFDLQRFYALGIDAYRLARALLTAPADLSALDGVTGRITLGPGNTLNRDPSVAQFREGTLRLLPDSNPATPTGER